MTQHLILMFMLTFILTGSANLVAQANPDPLACVDPDIANTLLGMPGESHVEIVRQIPAGYADFDLPKGLVLIGSRQGQHMTIISFKSAATVSKTKAVVVDMLEQADWQKHEQAGYGLVGGFQNPQASNRNQALTFCHETYGFMNVSVSKNSADSTYVLLTGRTQREIGQCDIMRMGMQGYSNVRSKLPVLDIPEGARASGVGGGASGYNQATSRMQLETTLSAAELMSFFGAQLVNQDWGSEGQWVGQRVSGSGWLSPDDKYSGALQIVVIGEDAYKLGFQMIRHR